MDEQLYVGVGNLSLVLASKLLEISCSLPSLRMLVPLLLLSSNKTFVSVRSFLVKSTSACKCPLRIGASDVATAVL
jgi:hypothetical protein